MKQDKKRQDTELDLDSILQQHGISLDVLNELSEEMRPEVLKSYIESQLRFIEKEKPSFGSSRDLMAEREERLLDACEYAASYEGLESVLLRGIPLLDSTLRSKLQPWRRLNGSKSGITAKEFEKNHLKPYFAALARLQGSGYELSDLDATQLILDGLAEDIQKETFDYHQAREWRRYDRYTLMWEMNHRQVEKCAELFDILEKQGGTPDRQALLDCLYALIITPRTYVHYPIDWPGEKSVLISFEESVSRLEERFNLLGRFLKRGYVVDYQKAADSYTQGLSSSDFLADKESGKMTSASQHVLSRLAWLEKKGASLSETYKQLAKGAIEGINEGSNPQRYLPLLQFLADHDAFGTGQLALLKAVSKP